MRQDSLEGDEQATGRGGLDFGRPTLLAVLTGTPDEVFRGEGKIQAIQLSAGGATVGHDLLREQRSGNSSGFGHVPQAQAAGAFIPVASIPLLGQNGAFSTSASPPSLPVSVEDQANVARVARGIAGAVNQNGGVVTLRLQPPEMGMVRIELQINNGTVRVAVVAEQESARAMLHDQIAQLRHALESQGLNVERLNVQAMQSNDPATNTEQQAGDSPAEGRSRGSFDAPGSDGEGGGDGSETRDGSATFQQTLNAVA